MLIIFEGIDGSGKTTIANKLEKYFLKKNKEVIYTREPGGLKFSESIRDIIFKNSNLSDITLTMLFLASRIDHLEKLVLPSLNKNKIVICDRYYYSSIVYQGMLGNAGEDYVLQINKDAINKISSKLWEPDFVFYIEVDVNTAKERRNKQKQNYFDNFDIKKYKILNDSYLKILNELNTKKNIFIIDGNKNIDEILEKIISIINDKS